MSSSDQWKEISALYAAALERPDTERTAFLRDACGGDEDLLREVISLLDCHDDAQQSLTSTAAHVIVNAMTAEAVSLAGRQLGAYRLEAPLATGGMGEVYRAVDTRLHRPVAIKILPHHLREDAARRERFEREAQAVAALHHPHICVLHDLGQADGIDFLVMELLEGETMADRLTRGPMPVEEALQHAVAIADALVATHRAGIVHRDLKPANIMLTESGAKLLDFGLAKLQRADGASDEVDTPAALASPRADRRSTTTVFGGTLPYMTPEHFDRKEVDHRSDIFAFGAVLYEMLTGQRAFDGTDRETVVNAIRTDVPVVVPADIVAAAPGLDALILKCLRRDPADRWQDTAAMADALRAVAGTSRGPTRWLRLSRTRAAAVAALLALAMIVTGTLMWRAGPSSVAGRASPAPAPVPSRQLTFTGAATVPEIDPNGRFVAYWNGGSLLVQDSSGGDPIEVFHMPKFGWPPRWSPNGSQLLVFGAKGTFIVPRVGGTPQRIGSSVGIFPTWRDESTIVGINRSVDSFAIVALDVGTGERTAVCDLPPDVKSWSALDWSSAQNAFLVVISTGKNVRSSLRTLRSGDCRSTLIVDFDGPEISARWASDGKAIYYGIHSDSAGVLWKVRVGSSAEPLGTPTLVRDGITGPFSMSSNNTLVHERRTTSSTIAVVSDAKAGAVVRPITEGTAVDTDPEFSPDGTRVAFARQGNIFVTSGDGRSPRRITSSFKTAARPVWSPDARRIAFHTAEGGGATIWTVEVDTGTLRSFTASVHLRVVFPALLHWAPAAEILFTDANSDIRAVDPGSGAVRLLAKPFLWDDPGLVPAHLNRHPSPDHSRVVALQQPAGGSGRTYKVFAFSDGGGVTDERNLLRRPDARYGPVIGWTSDDWIYVHAENPREILRIPAAGGLARHVVTLPEPPLAVTSISTGHGVTRFVGTVRKTLSDIWLTENFDQDR